MSDKATQLDNIFSQFDKSANRFCKDTNGTFCEITSEYKGDNVPENLTYRFAKIYYNSFRIDFKYTAHSFMNVTNSILECLIYPDKSEHAIGVPLPFAVDYFDYNTAYPLCIPLISNCEGMAQAFACIGSVVAKILSNIEALSYDEAKKTDFTRNFIVESGKVMKDDNFSVLDVDETHYKILTLRFSSSPFINFIKGKKEKAIKQMEKTKNLTAYEKRVISIWKAEESPETPDLSAIIPNAQSYNDSGVKKSGFKGFSTMFLSWLILTIPISAVYVGIYFLLIFISSRNSVYVAGPLYNFPLCIFAAFITSIAVSYFTRLKFYRLFFRKSYEKYCEMDAIENGANSDKIIKIFLYIIITASLVLIVLFSKFGVNFKDNGFVDNTKFFSLSGEFYSYKEIDHIYYKPDRVNDFGDVLDFPSYVLVLKNGKEIDLYEFDEAENFEEHLLDLLQNKGVKIQR